MMSRLRRRRGRKLVDSVPFWWHSIDLGGGMVTPGENDLASLQGRWEAMRVPPLEGKTVLDVGAWDGWFSFEAERRGAQRVVALDHYVWSLDLAAQQRYWQACGERGDPPAPYHEVPELWKPEELPGKRGFDVAKEILDSGVEDVVADFATVDPDRLGAFDVVLFLGVLYHLQDPFGALRRLARLTRETAVIETVAIDVRGAGDAKLCEFYEGAELNGDVSNWWAPTIAALGGMCRAAGFDDVEVLEGPDAGVGDGPVRRFRVMVHARRDAAQVD